MGLYKYLIYHIVANISRYVPIYFIFNIGISLMFVDIKSLNTQCWKFKIPIILHTHVALLVSAQCIWRKKGVKSESEPGNHEQFSGGHQSWNGRKANSLS